MKKKEKQKHQYVDQFRKISTLEKLPTLEDRLQVMFDDDVQKDNNNFMRMRKEPVVDRYDFFDHQNMILQNQAVQEKVNNRLNQQDKEYQFENQRVRNHIKMFKDWSDLNKNTQNKNQTFKFFYKNASPPKKTSEIATNSGADELKKKFKDTDLKMDQQTQINEIDILNNLNNQKFKYDFKLINQKRLDEALQKTDLKNPTQEKEEDIFVLTFKKFENYKTLQQIQAIDQNKFMEQDFTYDLNTNPEAQFKLDNYFFKKFLYKSVAKALKNTQKDVEYFRDIGLPSRSLDKYTETLQQPKQGINSLQQQTKQQAHFLHLLRESQLNIDKNGINFDDVSNLSNGRVTSLNAYMCIRSEKVTKAQFQKLLKKLDRYKKQQMQKGKQKTQQGIMTQDIEIQYNQNQKAISRQQKNEINDLVQYIMEIRQSAVLMQNKKQKPGLDFKQSIFKKQKFTRMQLLLKKLYEKIVVNPVQYPFTFLQDYIDKVDQILLQPYRDGKMLWFILDCYEEILNNLPNQDNIKTILKKKPIQQPKVTHYKGKKVTKQETLRVTDLYTYKDRSKNPAQMPTNDRTNVGKNTKNLTPNKSTTPTKTAQKRQIYTNTFQKTSKRL